MGFGFHNSCFIGRNLELYSNPNSVLTIRYWQDVSAKLGLGHNRRMSSDCGAPYLKLGLSQKIQSSLYLCLSSLLLLLCFYPTLPLPFQPSTHARRGQGRNLARQVGQRPRETTELRTEGKVEHVFSNNVISWEMLDSVQKGS